MVDGMSNVYKRISEIRSAGKNMSNNFKPERVKEFEDMYKESIS